MGGQVSDIIRHSKDSAAELPRRALLKQLYGATSIYARSATEDQVTPHPRIAACLRMLSAVFMHRHRCWCHLAC